MRGGRERYILWAGTHDRAGFCGTVLSDCSIEHVDLVEEVNSCGREGEGGREGGEQRALAALTVDCYPFVQVLSLWQLDSQLEVATAKSGRRMFHHVMLVTALRDPLEVFHSLCALVPSDRERERERNSLLGSYL